MNRRSAITIAAGLVLTMVVAGGAIALGMTGPSQATTADPAQPTSLTRPSPEVHTITRTVRVERGNDDGSVAAAEAGSTTASPAATSAPWDDDARNDDEVEDDHGDDDDADHDADDDSDDDSDDRSDSDDDHGDDD